MTTPEIPNITRELREAVYAYIAAQAYTMLIRTEIETYEIEILLAHELVQDDIDGRNPEASQPITQLKDDWLMRRDQAAAYFAALDAAHLAHGFVVAKPGESPLLVAEYAELKQEWRILKAAEYITGISCNDACGDLEVFKKLIDITTRMVVQHTEPLTNDERVKFLTDANLYPNRKYAA